MILQNKQVLIFDLGGVLLNLNQQKTIEAFAAFGLMVNDLNASKSKFADFETGIMDDIDFRNYIRSLSNIPIADVQIDNAWNAMLLDIKLETIQLLEQLSQTFTIYLLSNTNSIHLKFIKQYIHTNYTWQRWCNIFERQFFSFEIGMRKPDKKIYNYVLNSIRKNANQCIFMDDSLDNIIAAKDIGILTLHANNILDKEMVNNVLKYRNKTK